MFYKYLMIIAAIMCSSVSYAQESQGECSNYAKAAAIRLYKATVGTVQGSEGIQYEIKQKLKARKPFHNYIVSITDNNEDGEVWTLDYFVMTKKENGKCLILKVKEETPSANVAVSGVLKVTTYNDFNDNDLDNPIAVDVTLDFVNNTDNYIDFRIFTDEDTYPAICYSGSKEDAVKVINAILDVTTGDSFILTSKINFKGEVIVHEGTYTEGSGDYDFPLDFEVKKCL